MSAPEVTRTSRCVREAGRPKKNACRLLRGASKSQGCGKEPSVSGCYLSAGEVLPAPGEQPLFYIPHKKVPLSHYLSGTYKPKDRGLTVRSV